MDGLNLDRSFRCTPNIAAPAHEVFSSLNIKGKSKVVRVFN
jgi:hypothetical protein